MTLAIGTSGWSYPEWKPEFYPAGLPQKRFLEHYSSILSACEVNATFYRLQKSETFESWSALTPPGFRFAVKMHRRITHAKQIGGDPDFVAAFLESVASLGPRLGPVLCQFPPYRRRDDHALFGLIETFGNRQFACEFRHDSWNVAELEEEIARRGGTVCLSNTSGAAPESLPPGALAYVRLRTDRYTHEQRSAWMQLLEAEASLREVFVFAKHEGIPAGDPYGGVGLAQWMAGQRRNAERGIEVNDGG